MADPKKAKVKVELKKSNTKAFLWDIKSDLKKDGKLKFRNKNHPGFIVHFDIDDDDDTGYFFHDNHELAIGVQPYTGDPAPCPGQAAKWCQFFPVSVTEGNTRLEVRNLNEDETEFKYTLFVTKTPHAPDPKFEPIDPIGSNQNGPRFTPAVGVIALAIGAAAITFALAYTFGVFEQR